MYNRKKVILNIQFISTILFILSLLISLLLNYNEKQKLNNNSIFSDSFVYYLSLFNKLLILLLSLIFLYCNYETKKISNDRDILSDINLQIYANYLSIIAAIIILYVVYKNKDSIIDFSNPNL